MLWCLCLAFQNRLERGILRTQSVSWFNKLRSTFVCSWVEQKWIVATLQPLGLLVPSICHGYMTQNWSHGPHQQPAGSSKSLQSWTRRLLSISAISGPKIQWTGALGTYAGACTRDVECIDCCCLNEMRDVVCLLFQHFDWVWCCCNIVLSMFVVLPCPAALPVLYTCIASKLNGQIELV